MLFKILKGPSSRISTDTTPFKEGYCYFTPDDGGFYIDAADNGENRRILINPKTELFQGTLKASGWSNKRQTVAVAGLGADQDGIAGVDGELSAALMTEAQNASLYISGQAEGSLTITARGTVPTQDIPIYVAMFA